jgi:hypothetical protein
MNVKVISTLVSMAVVSFFLFLFAVFYVKPLHAQTLVFNEVAIEDGSLVSLNTNLKVEADAKILPASSDKDKKEKDDEDKASSTVTQSTVSSTTDLDIYTRTVTAEDDNVSNVVVKDDSVAVSYKEPARIFGIIPTEVTVVAEVNNDGTVILKYPWYAFLSGKNAGQLKPGLQMKVGQILRNATTTYATTTATTTDLIQQPHIRALLIHTLQTALRDFRMNATTTATTTLE